MNQTLGSGRPPTPEELAMMPAHPHPRDEQDRADLELVTRCLLRVRAMRVFRVSMEYPLGHPEGRHPPKFVRDWESQYGPAHQSAVAVLDEVGCTDPNREECPRKCMDFCNEKASASDEDGCGRNDDAAVGGA